MLDLDLSSNELLVYALIYGFSQDGRSTFSGSVEYIREWLGCSRKTVFNTLQKLVDRDLLHKETIDVNGVTLCEYSAVERGTNYTGGVKITPGGCKNYTGGGVKITPNNISHNIDILSHTQDYISILHSLQIDEAWRYNSSARIATARRLAGYIADACTLGQAAQIETIAGAALNEGIAPDQILRAAMDARSIADFAAATMNGG